MKKALLLITFLLPFVILAQEKKEKVKGSKIVELKSQMVEAFTSIEVGDFFEVELVEKSTPSISIDADNNFHQFINVKVVEGKLEITTTKHFYRYKRLLVEIGVTPKLANLFVKGKAKLFTKSRIAFENLNVESLQNAEVDINFLAEKASFYAKDKSEIKSQGQFDSVSVNLTGSADMILDIKTKSCSVLQNSKSKLILKGNSENSIFQVKDDSFLNAADLASLVLMFSGSEKADSYINVADKVTLDLNGESTTHILGNPLIDLKVFKGGSSIHKTDKAPSNLKNFLN